MTPLDELRSTYYIGLKIIIENSTSPTIPIVDNTKNHEDPGSTTPSSENLL